MFVIPSDIAKELLELTQTNRKGVEALFDAETNLAQAKMVQNFAGDKNEIMMDSHSRNGSYITSTYQVSIPEGTTANRVPMTVSKSRLQ